MKIAINVAKDKDKIKVPKRMSDVLDDGSHVRWRWLEDSANGATWVGMTELNDTHAPSLSQTLGYTPETAVLHGKPRGASKPETEYSDALHELSAPKQNQS